MTLPLQEGARIRPARSCLPCRKAKHRCQGGIVAGEDSEDALASEPCLRCQKMGVECVYAGLRRIGRPRRLQEGQVAKPRLLSLKGTSTDSNIAGVKAGALGTEVIKKDSEMKFEGEQPVVWATNDGTLVWNEEPPKQQSVVVRPQTPLKLESDQEVYTDHLDMANIYLPTMNQRPFFFPTPSPSPTLPPHFSSTEIYSLAEQYLSIVHPFLPILNFVNLNTASVSAYLRSQTPMLSFALKSLLDTSFAFTPPPEAFGVSIPDLQAALIVIHAAYGRGDSTFSMSTIEWLAARILGLGWHLVDNASSTIPEQEKYGVRKIWWETWSVDVFLGIVTGTRNFQLQNIAFEVHSLEASNAASTLKLRSLALLVTCTTPPPPYPQAFPPSRSPALTSLASTLYILSHAAYQTHSLPDPHSNPYALAASREAAFMSVLISSASTIFLLSSSSEFSAYIAPAFPCGLDTISAPPPVEMHNALRIASNQMFDFLALSPAPLVKTEGVEAGRISPVVHSPFFGCAVLVATQGSLLTAELDDILLLDSSSTSMEADGQVQISSASIDNSKRWRAFQVRNQLDLAEKILEEQAWRWSGAGMVWKEVRQLRSNKDGMASEVLTVEM